MKPSFNRVPNPEDVLDQRPTALYKKVDAETLQRTRDRISRLVCDLAPVADRLSDRYVANCLEEVQDCLDWACDTEPGNQFVLTRNASNFANQGNEASPSPNGANSANGS